ncbi:MAG: LuxR C-terminal-related transcriptional regulator [Chloroflexota bacterium]
MPVAWLSLDAGDAEPMRFLRYLVAALQRIAPEIGQNLNVMRQAPSVDALLTEFINALAALSDAMLIVLDDYHMLESPEVDQALIFLLEYLPPHVHLVIATREDPQLPLPRLRARRQLTEIRVRDLRFTVPEATTFLNQIMQLNLPEDAIQALENRTEGWITGLQLAALSMQGNANHATFIMAFTGSHRFVLDYLVDEVLQRQPDTTRQFLLQTSILNRLSVGLCDAMIDTNTSNDMLQALERGNLFLVPLDDTRQWYRYHHLFAEALRAHATRQDAALVATYHQRACDWYAQHDLPREAIPHALAAEDFDRAAPLIEQVWSEMDQNYELATWIQWVQALPDDVVLARPLLSLGYGWALLNRGDLDAAEARFHDAEQTIDAATITDDRFRNLPAAIAAARTYSALTLGDIATTFAYSQRAIDLAGNIEQPSHRQAIALRGVAHWSDGDLVAADTMLQAFWESMWQIGEYGDAMGIAFVLAEIRTTLGQLTNAFATVEHTLQIAIRMEPPPSYGIPDLYRSLGELHLARGEIDTATHHLTTAEKLGAYSTLTNWEYRLYSALADLRLAQGDYDTALELLDEAASVITSAPLPIPRAIEARKATIWLRQGNVDTAQTWAQHVPLDADLTYLNEFEYTVRAHVLLVRDALPQALNLLSRLEANAQSGNRIGNLISIHILQALAHNVRKDQEMVLSALQLALEYAAPHGYMRPFLDVGAPLQELLKTAQKYQLTPDFSQRLQTIMAQAPTKSPARQNLMEPLSKREQDVLRMLHTELSGPEIARELMISLNTMRTHTKNIYSKLSVNSRHSAVRRAQELDLL